MEIRRYVVLHRRRCPKCGGNVSLERDRYGFYWKCLQCATTWEIGAKAPAKVPATPTIR